MVQFIIFGWADLYQQNTNCLWVPDFTFMARCHTFFFSPPAFFFFKFIHFQMNMKPVQSLTAYRPQVFERDKCQKQGSLY